MIKNHPQRTEIINLICNFVPGRVAVQVENIKVRDKIQFLINRIKAEYGIKVSREVIDYYRGKYGSNKINSELESVKRIESIML